MENPIFTLKRTDNNHTRELSSDELDAILVALEIRASSLNMIAAKGPGRNPDPQIRAMAESYAGLAGKIRTLY